jgi:hypothetical protein
MESGKVLIVGSGQAGTCLYGDKDSICVLLRNGDLWYGNPKECREPQDQADLDAAPVDFDRFK